MKLELDKYYTEDSLAKYCVNKMFEILSSQWDHIIEPSAGSGSFLNYLPKDVLAYDIKPEAEGIIEQDFLTLDLPYSKNTLVIGNPPFGRANKLSVKFIRKATQLGDYVSFIQPISQLNNERIAGVQLLYSEDLGNLLYSGKKVHCCLNIYKSDKSHKRNSYDFPGLIECRHIFRMGCQKHPDEIINQNWDFRITAWGKIRLLEDDETSSNEVVIKCEPEIKEWIKTQLEKCDYSKLVSCVSSPNLPAWRLKKYLYEAYLEETSSS